MCVKWKNPAVSCNVLFSLMRTMCRRGSGATFARHTDKLNLMPCVIFLHQVTCTEQVALFYANLRCGLTPVIFSPNGVKSYFFPTSLKHNRLLHAHHTTTKILTKALTEILSISIYSKKNKKTSPASLLHFYLSNTSSARKQLRQLRCQLADELAKNSWQRWP